MVKKIQTKTTTLDVTNDVAPGWWQQRWGVYAVCAVSLVLLTFVHAGRSWPLLLDHALTDIPLLLLWLTAAFGYGSLLGKLRPRHGFVTHAHGLQTRSTNDETTAPSYAFAFITQLALGFGILSTLQLLLGLAGFIHQFIAFAVIALGVALAAIRIRPQKLKAFYTARATAEYLWLLAMPVCSISIVAAYIPPGILWGDEPNGYDVLEYHLQIPREWYDLGRIVPLHHNVFSYFPQGMEMHYLLAMQLKSGPWAGMYLAQLMHLAMIALTILAIYATARRFAPIAAAILAAVAAAHIPWLTLLAPVAYNEGALLLFGTLAIAWTLRTTDLKSATIAGLLTGFACAVKLTAVPEILLLVPILLLFSRPPRLRAAATFVLAALIAFSPWLIRNTLWAHNPLFPEAQHLLGHAHWTEPQTQRWQIANHLPGASQRSAMGRLTAAATQIFADWRYAWLLLPFAILAALLHWRNARARALLFLLLAWLVFWIFFTHVQSRFYTLSIPIAAILFAHLYPIPEAGSEVPGTRAAGTPKAGLRWIFYTLTTAQILLGAFFITNLYTNKIAPLADKSILGFEDLSKLLPDDVQAALNNSSRPIALIGDAKAFLYQISTQRLYYRTVFDVDVKPNESTLKAWLKGAPADAIKIIDPPELARFAKTYDGIPPLPSDFSGPRDHAFVMP